MVTAAVTTDGNLTPDGIWPPDGLLPYMVAQRLVVNILNTRWQPATIYDNKPSRGYVPSGVKGALRDIRHFGSHFGFQNHTKTFKILIKIMLYPYKRHTCIQIISKICQICIAYLT